MQSDNVFEMFSKMTQILDSAKIPPVKPFNYVLSDSQFLHAVGEGLIEKRDQGFWFVGAVGCPPGWVHISRMAKL